MADNRFVVRKPEHADAVAYELKKHGIRRKDLALYLHRSEKTVSNALRSKEGISPELRDRYLKGIKEIAAEVAARSN